VNDGLAFPASGCEDVGNAAFASGRGPAARRRKTFRYLSPLADHAGREQRFPLFIGAFLLPGRFASVSLLPIRGDIRYQPLVEGNLLDLPGSAANVYRQSVYLKNPYHRIVFKTAWQGPVWIKLLDLEHLSNRRQFCRPATHTDAESSVDVAQAHVRRVALIVQKVYPANGADDAASPGVWATAKNW
jgi:hypothetical protein